LAQIFALYLRQYPEVDISFDGTRIDPQPPSTTQKAMICHRLRSMVKPSPRLLRWLNGVCLPSGACSL
jgi:hypothetical protein